MTWERSCDKKKIILVDITVTNINLERDFIQIIYNILKL
jgi:hypothetical protein